MTGPFLVLLTPGFSLWRIRSRRSWNSENQDKTRREREDRHKGALFLALSPHLYLFERGPLRGSDSIFSALFSSLACGKRISSCWFLLLRLCVRGTSFLGGRCNFINWAG